MGYNGKVIRGRMDGKLYLVGTPVDIPVSYDDIKDPGDAAIMLPSDAIDQIRKLDGPRTPLVRVISVSGDLGDRVGDSMEPQFDMPEKPTPPDDGGKPL
ncbi:hypothetical protein GOV12_07180 [Candidatus Pacearchaeota archaeon]|nr:hypothetical protein [Candidatus Pacearchaeota archaeon]